MQEETLKWKKLWEHPIYNTPTNPFILPTLSLPVFY